MADLSFHNVQFRNKDSQNTKKMRRRDQLVLRYRPLVDGAANDIYYKMSRAIELEDLMQIGMLSLIQAAEKFEDRGVGFAAYAKLRVKGAMIDALRSISDESRTSRSKRRELDQGRKALEKQTGCKPSDKALAASLGLDNQACIAISKNPEKHSRTKHIEVRYHFIRDAVSDGIVKLQYVNTNQQIADMLTKPVNGITLRKHSEALGLKYSNGN